MSKVVKAIYIHFGSVFDALIVSHLQKRGVKVELALGSGDTTVNLLTKLGINYSVEEHRCLDKYLNLPVAENSGWSMEKFSLSNRTKILGEIDETEERQLYSKVYTYWERYIEENDINLMIIKNTPHEIFDYILYQIFKEKKRKVIVLEKTYWPGITLLLTDVFSTTCLVNHHAIDVDYDIADKNGMTPYWTKAKRAIHGDERTRRFDRLRTFSQMMIGGVSAKYGFLSGRYRTKDEISSFSTFSYLLLNFRIAVTKRRIINDYYRNLVDINYLQDGQNVVFYLQCEPEKNISPLGGKYFDQIKAIQVIREWLPEQYNLIVKEHPSQFQRWHYLEKGRYVDYYSRISASGAYLISHTIDNKHIFERSLLNISSSGSVVLEAWLMGYKAAFLGSPWYQIFDSIPKVSSRETLVEAIDSAPDERSNDEKLRNIEKFGFTGPISPFDQDISVLDSNIYNSSSIIAEAIFDHSTDPVASNR